MTIQNVLLYGQLLLFVGGPTTIGAALAIRGAMTLTRMAISATATGVVATTAAFLFMSAQGGGGGATIPGAPGVPVEALEVEVLVLTFEEGETGHRFRLGESTITTDEAENVIREAARIGHVRELQVHDTVDHTGGEIMRLRQSAQERNIKFTLADADDDSDQ